MREPRHTRSFGLTIAAMLASAGAAHGDPPLLGTGSRSFHTGREATGQGFQPFDLAAADFDADGDLDVVMSNAGKTFDHTSRRFSVLLNRGDGTYEQPIFVATAGPTFGVVSGDFNGDARPDLAFTQSPFMLEGDSVLVFINAGGGAFQAQRQFATGRAPKGIVSADFNGDGDLDLATANNDWGENDVSVLLNDGAGNFGTRRDFFVGEQPYRLAAGDLDGDGDADLAVTMRDTNPAFMVLTNDGLGHFGAPEAFATIPLSFDAPVGVAIVDIDSDGDEDILYGVGDDEGRLALFRNAGGGVFGAHETVEGPAFLSGGHDFAFADVTGDGWLDIFTSEYAAQNGWALIPSDGSGGFGAPSMHRADERAGAIELGDADGDGDPDLLICNHGSNTVSVFTNDGGSFPDTDYVTTSMVGLLDLGDIDLDGDLDAVTVSSSIHTLKNDGTGVMTVADDPRLFSLFGYIELRDYNGDGYPDLGMCQDRNGLAGYDFFTAMNLGDGSYGPISRWPLVSCGTYHFTSLDWDNDGDLDVIASEEGGCPGEDKRLFYLEGNGDGTFQPRREEVVINDAYAMLASADLDGDGNADLVASGRVENTVGFVVRLGNGDGTFGAPAVFAPGSAPPPINVSIADVTGDGILDLVGSGGLRDFLGSGACTMRGNGDGTFTFIDGEWACYSLTTGGLAGHDTTDIDGDGDLDVIAGAWGAQDVAVLLNDGSGALAPEDRYGAHSQVVTVCAGDFDGDGRDDVAAKTVTPGPVNGGVNFLFNAGGGGGCDADFNGDGSANTLDVLAFLNAWSGRDPRADFNGDGVINTQDVLSFLNAWTAGCP
ncbi:MAG TPA: FG-GAP-like repeat-containing protein [Phycisphaerales bacterium]|nr:FG-GAP-like repeat-containing protein [Phycisphaerales bacterium]